MKIIGERIFLKCLTEEDASSEYVSWMNDSEITQFLESKGRKFTLQDIKDYIKKMESSLDNYLFGIFLKDTGQHIGNIKIGGINSIHKFAEMGLIIGKKELHGKGYGTEAIKLATKYAFEKLGLNKLVAGMYENNIGSYKAFIKAGYREVGRLRKHRLYKGRYVDEILVERCKDE